MSEPRTPFIQRVILRNYKSIRQCDVSLGPLTLLVGPNGSGKSNFLEALRFIGDSLQTTMEHAIEQRGEVRKIFWRGREATEYFSIKLSLTLENGEEASYYLRIADESGLALIDEEQCVVRAQGTDEAGFHVRGREVSGTTITKPPPASQRQLYLTTVSGYLEFSRVYDLLKGMRFFNIDPQQIRVEASSGKPSHELMRDGQGALFTAHRVAHNQHAWTRMGEYLKAVLPMLDEVGIETTLTDIGRLHGTYITRGQEDVLAGEPKSLKFLVCTGRTSLAFDSQNISDGTLRAFGVLLALFQCLDRPGTAPIPLVGIEEPEATLHPAAAGVLFDALHEASHFTQVLATTHSAELLDIKDVDPDSLLIVDMVNGETTIGPADEATRSIMRDRLATAGELLRDSQLRAVTRASGPVGVETDGG